MNIINWLARAKYNTSKMHRIPKPQKNYLQIIVTLNEQFAYKGGCRAKKMAIGINYCQNGRLAKAKVTVVFWTQALSHN